MSYENQPIVATASLTLDRKKHEGNVVSLNSLTGLTVTLPASVGNGDRYRLFIGITNTSLNYVIQVANGTDIMAGVIGLTTDIAGSSMPTSTTTDTITMNGSTTGGLRGSSFEFVDVAAGFWMLNGNVICTSTEATPFSAAVS